MQMIHGVRSEDYPIESSEAKNAEDKFKICPICGARCFADMDICFGCLHRFSEDESSQTVAPPPPSQAALSPEALQQAKIAETALQSGALQTAPTTMALSESATSQPFDHTHDIISLQKPTAEALTIKEDARTASDAEGALTAHHICSDKDGHQFKIAISIKML